MDVRNCRSCGRLFNVMSNPRICPECVQKIEDKFQEVKAYLRDNPYANMDELSRECEVSVKQIKEWVRDERLVFGEDSVEGVECEQCGKLIRTGKYCDECKLKIANNLRSAIHTPTKAEPQKKDRDRDRMRFLQNL